MANVTFNQRYEGINQREQNLFREEYYSGTDTRIYFDGVEQFEIAHIAYTVQEQLLPIFGYASRTFDTVAVGNRIVNGTFTVTIKNNENVTSTEEIIEAAKTNFELNEEYNANEIDKQNKADWVNDGNGSLYPYSYAADEMKHAMDGYDEYQVQEANKEKYINSLPDSKFIEMLKKLGYTSANPVLDFQKDRSFLENNGILDNKTKKQIYALYRNKSVTSNNSIKLYAGPAYTYPEIGTVNSGTKYWIEDRTGNWAMIKVVDGGVCGFAYMPDD